MRCCRLINIRNIFVGNREKQYQIASKGKRTCKYRVLRIYMSKPRFQIISGCLGSLLLPFIVRSYGDSAFLLVVFFCQIRNTMTATRDGFNQSLPFARRVQTLRTRGREGGIYCLMKREKIVNVKVGRDGYRITDNQPCFFHFFFLRTAKETIMREREREMTVLIVAGA